MLERKRKITKTQIVKALEKEPLSRGAGFEDPSIPDCRVCAVGAVIRNIIPERDGNNMYADMVCGGYYYAPFSNQKIDRALDDGQYLGALSQFFELYPGDLESARWASIAFVQGFFPEKFWVDF